MLNLLATICFWLSGSLGALGIFLYMYIVYLAKQDKALWGTVNKVRLLYISSKEIIHFKQHGGATISNLCIWLYGLLYTSVACMLFFVASVIYRVETGS